MNLIRERKIPIVWLTKIAAKFFLFPFFRITTSGLSYLPRDRAFILLPKHQRWEDIPLLSIATPRYLYYIAKYELFVNPFSRRFLFALGGLPLNRSRPLESRQALKVMMRCLKRGEVIVIFPEGTYFKDRVGPGHLGIIRLIRSRTRVPFVPVGIKYTRRFVRYHVHMKFGEPIYDDPAMSPEDLLGRIMTAIAGLSGLPSDCKGNM